MFHGLQIPRATNVTVKHILHNNLCIVALDLLPFEDIVMKISMCTGSSSHRFKNYSRPSETFEIEELCISIVMLEQGFKFFLQTNNKLVKTPIGTRKF